LVSPLEPSDTSVDVLELGVAIGVVVPLLGLSIGLEVIADVLEETAYGVMTDSVAEDNQGIRQVTGALGCPNEWCLGVSSGGGLQEFVEVVEEHRVAIGEARPSCSRPAESVGRGFGSGTVKFGKSRSDGGPRDPRSLGDGRGSPPTENPCLGGSPPAEDAFVHQGGEGLIFLSQQGYSFIAHHILKLLAIVVPN
jgi:hypothetical protein